MEKTILQEEMNQLIEILTEKHLHKKPNKEGKLDAFLVELFNEEKEEMVLANLLDFDSNFEREHYIEKTEEGIYTYTQLETPKTSKTNIVKKAIIQSILLLKERYDSASLKQMNDEHATEFQEFFSLYFRGRFQEFHTYQLYDEDFQNKNWSERKMRQVGFDESTILCVKTNQENGNTNQIENDLHAFIKVDDLYYDIEHFNGVSNPIELRRIKEIMLGEEYTLEKEDHLHLVKN